VSARGRRFRTVRAGEGSPLVVFESGLATSSAAWADVQRKVAAHTATLSLDRAGVGGSSPARDGRLLVDLNADLEGILDSLEEPGPLLLVGQSWGGPVMRSFSHVAQRPLAGIVLVDGTKSAALGPKEGQALNVFFRLLGLLSRVGLHRKLRRKGCRGGAREAAGLAVEVDGGLEALEARGFPAGTPVTLMAAAVVDHGNEEIRPRFVESQRCEAEARGNRFVLVEDSRHDIHWHKPDLVVAEILALVERFRRACVASAVHRPRSVTP
jgi:pimeloyl-ACP methyl ester carboxylesterase